MVRNKCPKCGGRRIRHPIGSKKFYCRECRLWYTQSKHHIHFNSKETPDMVVEE